RGDAGADVRGNGGGEGNGLTEVRRIHVGCDRGRGGRNVDGLGGVGRGAGVEEVVALVDRRDGVRAYRQGRDGQHRLAAGVQGRRAQGGRAVEELHRAGGDLG